MGSKKHVPFSRGDQNDDRLSRGEKGLLFGGVGGAILILVGFLLYFFVFRDTWEDDNRYQVDTLVAEGSALQSAGKAAAAVAKYRDAITMVGARKVSDPTIVAAVKNAREALAKFDAAEQARQARIAEDRKQAAALAAQLEREAQGRQLAKEQQFERDLQREREQQTELQRRAALRATISGHASFDQGAQLIVGRYLEVSVIRCEIPASQMTDIITASRQVATQFDSLCIREAAKWDADGKQQEQAVRKALADSGSKRTLEEVDRVNEQNNGNLEAVRRILTTDEAFAATRFGFAKIRYAKAAVYRSAGKLALAGASVFSITKVQPGGTVDVRQLDAALFQFNRAMSAARNSYAGGPPQPNVRFGDDYVVWPEVVAQLTVAKAVTDINGSYVVSDVPLGKYLVRACRPGFDTEWLVPIDVTDGTSYTIDLGNDNANKWGTP